MPYRGSGVWGDEGASLFIGFHEIEVFESTFDITFTYMRRT